MMKNRPFYLFYLSVILPRCRLKGRNTTTFTKDHVSSAITTGKTGQRSSKIETNNEDPERHFEANVHNGIWNYEWHATCALFVVPWQANFLPIFNQSLYFTVRKSFIVCYFYLRFFLLFLIFLIYRSYQNYDHH